MNPTLHSIIPLIKTSLDVIGSFKGEAKLAKTDGPLQEAVYLVTSLTKLVQSFGNGDEVPPDEVRKVLIGKETLPEFYKLLAHEEAVLAKQAKADKSIALREEEVAVKARQAEADKLAAQERKRIKSIPKPKARKKTR